MPAPNAAGTLLAIGWDAVAAANNADWCEAMCRSHGIGTARDAQAWWSTTRSPPYYPDAVTLVPDPPVDDLLARIDTGPGCSIKDSFRSLDLTAFGFRVLFDAEWLVAEPDDAEPSERPCHDWDVVSDPAGLVAWEDAWRAEDDEPGVFRRELLDDHEVSIVAARDGGRVIAGAVLNASEQHASGPHASDENVPGQVVGISNLFAAPTAAMIARADVVAIARQRFPGAALCGYEHGPDADAAHRVGFHPVGPLRVWIRDGGPTP